MSDEGSYQLTLVNRGRQIVAIGGEQNLLVALEEAGVPMVSGCRTGACFTCACQLLWGRVHMEPGHAVPDDLLEQGVFLPCVSVLESDAEILSGSPGKPLLPNRIKPWTE